MRQNAPFYILLGRLQATCYRFLAKWRNFLGYLKNATIWHLFCPALGRHLKEFNRLQSYFRFITQSWPLLAFGFLSIFWGNFGQSFFISWYGTPIQESLGL